jgi:hypothetical protein
MICEAEPLHPDLRRFNKKGLFGIILKEPTVSRQKGSDLPIGYARRTVPRRPEAFPRLG